MVAPIKRPEVGSSLTSSLLAVFCHPVFMALQDPSEKGSTIKGGNWSICGSEMNRQE